MSMIIPWEELPGFRGPVENEYGLDELTRRYQGDATLWPIFKPTIALGGADAEFPGMYVVSIEPEGNEGGLMTATATFKGYSKAGDGSDKPAKISSGFSLKSSTAEGVAYLRYNYLDGLSVSQDYNTAVIPVPGELTYDVNVPTLTIRYIRSSRVLEGQYRTTALELLLAQPVVAFNKRFKQTGDLKVSAPSGATNVQWTYPAAGGTEYSTVRLSNLSCDPVGLWFECSESWELAVYDSTQGDAV